MADSTITMRTDANRKRRLREAADLTDQNLTSFILSAAEAEAERIIDASRFTDVSTTFFDQFDAQLSGTPTPHLRKAARRMSGIVIQAD